MKVEIKPLEKVSFTVKETAKIMSTGTDTIYALISSGELRCMKLPTKTIPGFEIERFMRKALEDQINYTDILKKQTTAY